MLAESWGKVLGFSYTVYRIFLLLSGVSLLPIFYSHKRVKSSAYVLQYFLLIIVVCLTIWSAFVYNEQ